MKADVLDSYLMGRFTSIAKNLRAYGEDMKPIRLHRLRIDSKKISALLSFIQITYQKEYDLSRLKNVFKIAGDLRESQLHIQLLEALDSPPMQVLSPLHHQKNGRKGAFKKNSTMYLNEVSQVQESITLPPKKLTRKKVEKYFSKRLKKARKDIGKKNRETAHNFRKQIKKVLYLYKALPKELKKKVALDAEYLDKIQKKAGDWHDTHAALDYINEQTEAHITTESKEYLKAKEEKQFKALITKVKKKRLSIGA